jgi:hypothetical protein
MTTTVEIDHYLIVRLRGQAAKRNTSVPRLIADIVKAVATDGLTTAVLATSVDASLHPLDLACLGYLKEQDISINCDGHHGTIPLVSHYWAVDGEIPKHLCPSCGRPMGLTRTVPAAPGYSELRTYGCRECGVWLTEGSTSRDQRHDTFVSLK